MTMYWCPMGVLGLTRETLVEDYRAANPHRADREPQNGHLYAYFQRHACTRFVVQPTMVPDQIVDRGGWYQEETPRVEPHLMPAVCEQHRTMAQVVVHEIMPMMITFARITGQWNCYPCGRFFDGDIEYAAHLNMNHGCSTWLMNQAGGQIPDNFPAAIVWPDNPELFVDEDEEHDRDDDDEPWEPDEEAVIDPLTRITFTFQDQPVTVANHYRDDLHAPVTTNDGRYLRWNQLTQQYEDARRPATTLHDLFGGQG